MTDELTSLAMPHAELSVAVTSTDDPDGLTVGDRTVRFSHTGIDDVELLLAANPGAEPRPLGQRRLGR